MYIDTQMVTQVRQRRYGDIGLDGATRVCGHRYGWGDLEELEDAVLQVLQVAGVSGQGQQQALLGLLQLPALLSHHLPQ